MKQVERHTLTLIWQLHTLTLIWQLYTLACAPAGVWPGARVSGAMIRTDTISCPVAGASNGSAHHQPHAQSELASPMVFSRARQLPHTALPIVREGGVHACIPSLHTIAVVNR